MEAAPVRTSSLNMKTDRDIRPTGYPFHRLEPKYPQLDRIDVYA